MKVKNGFAIITALTVILVCGRAFGDEPAAQPADTVPDKALAERIIDSWEDRMRGQASIGEMTMYIKKWDRTLSMKFMERYPDRSLVRVTSPASDAGTGSLKIGPDLWTYNPKIDQVQKIPPSLMLDGWMGSDFTNDDVSRTSSLKVDYDVAPPVQSSIDGMPTWKLTLTPKPDSPVVWDRLVVEVAKDDYRPLVQEFYDEDGKLARRMIFQKYRQIESGRNYPFLWRMENLQEKGRYTEVRVDSMKFVPTLPDSKFTIRAMKLGR